MTKRLDLTPEERRPETAREQTTARRRIMKDGGEDEDFKRSEI
jgi:hypothetical protein